MKTKYYFIFFIVFVVIYCGGFYTLSSGGSDITLSLGQTNITLHSVVWLAISIGVFFLFTLLFFIGNWFSKFTNSYRNDRDYDHLITQIYNQLLNHPLAQHSFKTPQYQTLSNILARVDLKANLSSKESQNQKIDHLFKELEEIEKGGVSKLDLAKDSLFWSKNMINKLKSDSKFANKVLEGEYPLDIKEKALSEMIENNQLDEKGIRKILTNHNDCELIRHLLYSLIQKGYKLGSKDLLEILKAVQASPKEFFQLAQILKPQLDPDACIELFHNLALQKEEAREAYVFILLDYSMIEKAQEFLADYEDLTLPKAFIELKKLGKNYPLEKFFE